jgi:glycosyltransferase involved in cell wall biosynthesis
VKTLEVAFNGKFLAAGPSGVHRVAEQLICNIDKLLDANPDIRINWELLVPKTGRRTLPLKNIVSKIAGRLTWQFWEQIELPILAKKRLLVSLCNLAPVIDRGGIVMIHDAQVFISPQSYSPLFRLWYRFVLPQLGASSARILTVSNFSREKLVHYGIAPRHKITVIYNGIDHQNMDDADVNYLANTGLHPSTYVVALANTQKHKNVEHLLKVFATPQMRDLTLVLVGNEGRADFLKKGLDATANVRFQGHVKDVELRALYEGAVCFAFPSTTEGFGLPPLEAMRAGCPTVVAPCGALPEVCEDGAVYADPHDVQGWTSAILRMRDDLDFRRALITSGHAQAAKFTWERSARLLLDLILETLDAR